jgi:hypothetical protein
MLFVRDENVMIARMKSVGRSRGEAHTVPKKLSKFFDHEKRCKRLLFEDF